MEDEKRDSYVAGIGSIIVFIVMMIMAISAGMNQSGYIFGAFGILFGILGIGCFVKPDFFGPILIQLFKNIGKNAEGNEQNTTTYTQRQTNPNDSPQVMVTGNKATVHIGKEPDLLKKAFGPPGRPSQDRATLLLEAYDISAGGVSHPISIYELQKQLGWEDINYIVNVAAYLQQKDYVKIQGKTIFLTASGIDCVESLKKRY